MHVFVTRAAAPELPPDIHRELVHLPVGVCPDCRRSEPCGWCEDAFTGVVSHRPTTTAEVADHDVTTAMVVAAVADSLLDGNLFWGARDARSRALDLAYSLTVGLLDVAADLPVGAVVERRRGRLLVRTHA